MFNGIIRHRDSDNVYVLEGICSEILYCHSMQKPNDKMVVTDMNNTEEKFVYYQNDEDSPTTSSLKVWRNVNEAIVQNDMRKADQEKKNIESEQRKRIASHKENGTDELAEHFEKNQDDGHWYFKDNITISNFFGQENNNNNNNHN